MNRFSIVVAVSVFAILAASGAWAANITIADTMGNGATGDWYRGVTTAYTETPVNENNEVEPGMQTGQDWDLEAVALNGQKLTLVGGWDFKNGAYDSAWHQYSNWRWSSGDVFLTLGTTAPKYGAAINWEIDGTATTETPNKYGFQFALHLDLDADQKWNSGKYSVIALNENSELGLSLATVYGGANYNNDANPWKWNSGGEVLVSGLVADFTSLDPGAYVYDNPDTPSPGGTHYSVTFDLSHTALGTVGVETNLWTHFTMECGNDMIMGHTGDYTPVPEPFSMVMLGCLGAGMLGARKARQWRKAAK